MKELSVQHRGKPLRAFISCASVIKAVKHFYKEMLEIADQQYKLHLSTLGEQSNG